MKPERFERSCVPILSSDEAGDSDYLKSPQTVLALQMVPGAPLWLSGSREVLQGERADSVVQYAPGAFGMTG